MVGVRLRRRVAIVKRREVMVEWRGVSLLCGSFVGQSRSHFCDTFSILDFTKESVHLC